MTLSRMLRQGSRVGFWKAMPAIERGDVTSCPATTTLPAVAGQRPVTSRMRVDLPQPDGPTTAMNSPFPTLSVAPWRARVPSTPP
jgi:hypothetical protein